MAQRHGQDYGRHRGGERDAEESSRWQLDRDRERERERWSRHGSEQDESDVRFGRNVGDIGGQGERYRGESRFGSTFGEGDESPQYYGTQRGVGGGQLGGRGDFGREDLRREFGERDLGETEFSRTSRYRDRGMQNYGGLGSSGGRDRYSGDDAYRRRQSAAQPYGPQGSGSYGYDEYYDFQRYGRGGMGGQSFRGRGPRGYQRTDDRVREIICEMLTEDPAIDASDIAVVVTSSVVTLDGTVIDRWTKYQVEELTESVSGVKEVRNQLRIDRGRDMSTQQSGERQSSQYSSESQFASGAQGVTSSQPMGSQYSTGSQPGQTGSTSKDKDRDSKSGKSGNAT
jgi:osmotically-inducible protein OsmY